MATIQEDVKTAPAGANALRDRLAATEARVSELADERRDLVARLGESIARGLDVGSLHAARRALEEEAEGLGAAVPVLRQLLADAEAAENVVIAAGLREDLAALNVRGEALVAEARTALAKVRAALDAVRSLEREHAIPSGRLRSITGNAPRFRPGVSEIGLGQAAEAVGKAIIHLQGA